MPYKVLHSARVCMCVLVHILASFSYSQHIANHSGTYTSDCNKQQLKETASTHFMCLPEFGPGHFIIVSSEPIIFLGFC